VGDLQIFSEVFSAHIRQTPSTTYHHTRQGRKGTIENGKSNVCGKNAILACALARAVPLLG
jgi:hypothetical protein